MITLWLDPGVQGLNTGATYVFAALYDPRQDLYGIGAPEYDRKMISDDPNLGNDQLKGLAEQDERVKQLQADLSQRNIRSYMGKP